MRRKICLKDHCRRHRRGEPAQDGKLNSRRRRRRDAPTRCGAAQADIQPRLQSSRTLGTDIWGTETVRRRTAPNSGGGNYMGETGECFLLPSEWRVVGEDGGRWTVDGGRWTVDGDTE